jgi:uncharacterized protein YceK
MRKFITLTVLTVTIVSLSGCYCVGTHVSDVQGGKKTTTGLLSFDAVDNGYPMIPVYSKFEADK